MPRIAIVAAMEREVRPLIRNWKARQIEHDGREYRLFESGDASLVCGGIGYEAARRATEAVIGAVKPQRVLSVGFAGALDASLEVGQVFEPRTVVNSADGSRADAGGGRGVLVSSRTVAGVERKGQLRKAYGADAVDMEAAAVAQGADARGVAFSAMKAISDAPDFEVPATEGFVNPDGAFRTGAFALHIALRPWLWASSVKLAGNSARASRALSKALGEYLKTATA